MASAAMNETLTEGLFRFNLQRVVVFACAEPLGVAGGGEFDFANDIENEPPAIDRRVDRRGDE
jgi:hypothetical protein